MSYNNHISYTNGQNGNYNNNTNNNNNGYNGYVPPASRSLGPSPVPTPGPGTPGSTFSLQRDIGGGGSGADPAAGPMTNNAKVQPLLCSGHTRPVTHLQFSSM